MKKLLFTLLTVLCVVGISTAQRAINGNISDTEGLALIGANVVVQGTTIGTITDIDGNFTLNVPTEAKAIQLSYTGFETMVVKLDDRSTYALIMSEGSLLGEVVVTGYNTTKKSDLVESISTVTGEKIANISLASTDNLLQGQSTGVEVTAVNGRPGSAGYIRIRGITSINGNNDPLFIVDGVPVPKEAYSAINPQDIAEFSILKDAAATSIYGARGSAGVILVSTKTGDAKNSYVEYTGQIGTVEALDDGLTLMNASQKLNYETDLGLRGVLTADQRADILRYGTDWGDALLRKAGMISHNLAFSGGTAKGSYYLSLSRFDQQGISVGSDFDRTSAKLNGSYEINDWISISNNINISRRNDNELRDRYNSQSPFVARYLYNPYETIYNLTDEGEIQYDEFDEPIYNLTHQGFNIVEAARNNPETNQWTDMYGSVALHLTPFDNFRFTSTGGYTFNNYNREYFIKPGSILDGYVGDANAPGIKTDSGNSRDRYIWSNIAQYDYSINESHSLSFLGGTEYLDDKYENYSLSSKGFPRGLDVHNVGAEATGATSNRTAFSLYSLLGSVNYTFDDNFQAKATVRRDGSSRFGANKRYGTFYSGGISYDLAKKFLADSPTFDQLKVRLSYGTTGNEPTGLYDPIGVLDFTSYNGQTAALQGNVANADLQWETQKALSFGLDYGLFNNKVTGSIEYYTKTAQDLLFPNQLSRTTGFSSRSDNIGDLSNKGIEGEIYYSPIRGNDFSIDLGLRVSYNKTKMEKLNTDELSPGNAFNSILKEGEVAYVWELVEYVGVDPQTGDLLYLDANGETTNSPTASDAKILSGKSAIPTYSGGVDLNINYKWFTFANTFSFKGGNYIYNQRKLDLLGGLDAASSQQSVEALDYWREPGDITEVPRPGVEVEASSSTRFLEKGDYLRWRNATISFRVPKSFTDRVKMRDVSIFVSATNLATLSGFDGDPEVGVFLEESAGAAGVGAQLPGEIAGFSYPNTRNVTGGIKLRF